MEILQACFFLILQLGYIDAQTDHLATNPDNYIADTKINGILNGTSPFTGITLEISKSAGTPNNINVKTQFALESRAITPECDFSQRAFLRLVQPLDRDGETATTFDDADVIEFQVKCTRLGSTSSSFFLMIVNVQDINDNSPVFSGAPYYVSVNEVCDDTYIQLFYYFHLTPIGTTVFRGVAAFDLDAYTNKDINFGIMPEDGITKSNSSLHDATELFEIQTTGLGYITIKSTLDFEKVKKYVFLISATDQATERSLRRTSTVTMTIDVTDGDDLGPVFDYHGCFRVDNVCFNPTYTTEISPHATATQLILRAAENQTMIDSVKARTRTL
ncbi:PCDH15 [Mytilus coruscus]|uniref:PCDH15 n=1 Tax=Mytilus coruscus TaxID=42192 RepID=A0A6J8EWD4_MYTCO|nr:PCDH15 [Mytilus coruscus]